MAILIRDSEKLISYQLNQDLYSSTKNKIGFHNQL